MSHKLDVLNLKKMMQRSLIELPGRLNIHQVEIPSPSMEPIRAYGATVTVNHFNNELEGLNVQRILQELKFRIFERMVQDGMFEINVKEDGPHGINSAISVRVNVRVPESQNDPIWSKTP